MKTKANPKTRKQEKAPVSGLFLFAIPTPAVDMHRQKNPT